VNGSGITKAKANSMHPALTANLPSVLCEVWKMNKKRSKWDLFKGYFSLTMLILFGCVLLYFGTILVLDYWVPIRTTMGPMGNIVLGPFIVGLALVGFGVAQLLALRKGERGLEE
jgi:hypothetical protein